MNGSARKKSSSPGENSIDLPSGQRNARRSSSTARATAVVRYLIYGLNMDPARLSATGFAQYRPVADNDTKEGRAQNRRIRAVVFKQLD